MAALTTEQAAQRLGTTDRTIRRMIKEKRLKAFRLSERHWRIEEGDLEAYIEKQKKLAENA